MNKVDKVLNCEPTVYDTIKAWFDSKENLEEIKKQLGLTVLKAAGANARWYKPNPFGIYSSHQTTFYGFAYPADAPEDWTEFRDL